MNTVLVRVLLQQMTINNEYVLLKYTLGPHSPPQHTATCWEK